MFLDAAEFRWKCPSRGGFVWKADAEGVRCLRRESDAAFIEYLPLKEATALYRELAAINLTPEGALVFANRYGSLGGPTIEQRERENFEVFHRWVETVAWLREALHVWNLYRQRNIAALAKIFIWENDTFRYAPSPRFHEALRADARADPSRFAIRHHLFDIAHEGWGFVDEAGPVLDVLRPAITLVTGIINGQLAANAGPRLRWDASTNKTIYFDAPFSLFGAVWLQFAQAVHSDKIPKQCRTCGRWFEVAGGRKSGSKRTDREFCSNSCRSKNYLQRQEEARQRHERGETPAKIAKELGTTSSIVKNWLKKKES
jgi:hypothetical protein